MVTRFMAEADLAHRIARLEAREDIRDVLVAFARGADAHCDPAQLAPLFTDDAVFDIGSFGVLTGGGAAIAAHMHANNSRGFYWTLHYMVSPQITLAEDCASASVFCYLWELAASHPDKGRKAFWIGGHYTADMVLQQGCWRIRKLKLHLDLLSPYAEGFAATVTSFEEV